MDGQKTTLAQKNELRVFYGGGLNEKLDEALENYLKDFGYHRWASGEKK